MKRYFPSLLESAVLIYCLIMARDLPGSWISSPLVRYNWIALIIWLFPLAYYVYLSISQNTGRQNTFWLLGAAVIVTTLGVIGELHALAHVGLALAFAGIMPWTWPMIVWIPTAISWLPALGWFLRLLPRWGIFATALGLAIIGSFCMLRLSPVFKERGVHVDPRK